MYNAVHTKLKIDLSSDKFVSYIFRAAQVMGILVSRCDATCQLTGDIYVSRAFIFVLISMFIPFAFAAWKLKIKSRSIITILYEKMCKSIIIDVICDNYLDKTRKRLRVPHYIYCYASRLLACTYLYP